MIRYGRRLVLRLFPALFTAWLCISATAVHGGRRDTIPPALAADANLNDMFFLDDKVGWAVGDRGVIWQTVNGGQDWNRRPFPTSDRLTTVCFHDVHKGWIGTSWTQPYLHTAHGQIWRTDDGGKSWQPSKIDTLPSVHTLSFTDARQGQATTEHSALHNSDLFQSHDGGRSWIAIHGAAARSRADGRTWQDLRAGFDVKDGDVKDGDVKDGVVKDGDVKDGPDGLAGEFDWLTMARHGNDVWIAGDPGTTVLHGSDGGRKWSVSRTGQALPIRQLRFINAQQGWAVGTHGTILATSDGGINWQPQRMVANRVAVLGIYFQATDIDWELLTQLSVQEGYRSHVLLVNENVCPDSIGAYPDNNGANPNSNGETGIERRAHEGAIIAGSGGVTCLRLRGGDDGAFTQRLVRALRTWQPDVVVTAGDSKDAKRLHAAIVAAIEQAAEPAAYPKQLSLAELRSWQVRKAFLREESLPERGTPRANGPVVATAQLVLPLGQSLADVGASCRAYIATGYDPPPSMVSYRSLLPSGNSRQIMTGVMSRRGSLSRRPALNATVGNVRDLSILAQRRRMAEHLLTKHVEGGGNTDVLLGQLDELISGMGQISGRGQSPSIRQLSGTRQGVAGPGQISSAEHEAAGDTVFRLSEMLAAHDRPVAAQALHQLFLHRFNKHPARDAVVWRQLQSATSAELQLWQARRSDKQNQAIPASVVISSATTPIGDVAPASLIVDNNDGNNTDIQQLMQVASPLLASRPEVRWALAMATYKNVAQRIAQQTTIDSQWQRRGAAEAWLTKRTTQIPTILWKCPQRPTPRLDGQLDDETWQALPRISLHALRPDDEKSTGSVAAAYDERFLYLAISCPKVAAATYPASKQTRQRDTDLSAFDRIALSIDTNRDAMSAWHLTIDSRGWANDACLDHDGWNPAWHIAVKPTASSWTVEAAIPLEELTTETITTGEAWAVAVRRHTPEGGTQAWPATVHEAATPQSFGLLLFE